MKHLIISPPPSRCVFRKRLLMVAIAAAMLGAAAGAARAETFMQQSVTQGGISWHFDKAYQVGQFANGDFWVLGPVTITRITPDFDGVNNGWEVNPIVAGGQGFQSVEGFGFDASLVPALPYRAEGRLSIVKTTPVAVFGQRIIKSAAVLTVVEAVPPGDGAEVFRPPYVGADKPYYRVADLRTDLLPSYAAVTPMPTLAAVASRFRPLQMDHKTGRIGRALRPQDSMDDYQPANTPAQNEAVLRLMMSDSIEAKMPALVQYVQFGIDKIHTIYLGQTWPDGGGHQPGHLVVAAFAAVMLDIPQAKQVLREATFFHGSRWFTRGRTGIVLWGQPATEYAYWNYIMSGDGNRSNRDPYGYIDGGKASEGSYQLITSQSHKGEILAAHLMPALKEAWPPGEWAMMKEYADRWVNHGQWTQPDPVAPYDGQPQHYGITFGPDPARPGEGIAGAGRYLSTHGANKDAGQYRSQYVAAMWNAYRASATPDQLEISSWQVAAGHGGTELLTAVTDGYIEPRRSGLRQLRIGFNAPLDAATVNLAAVSIVGDASGDCSHLLQSVTLDGDRAIRVVLTAALPDADRYAVSVADSVQGTGGLALGAGREIRLGALTGDVDGSGTVTAADVVAIRGKGGDAISAAAARFDIDGSGIITGADLRAARSRQGAALP